MKGAGQSVEALAAAQAIGAGVYRNALVLSAASHAGAVLAFFATTIFARRLTVENFGLLSASLAAAFLAFQFADLGISTVTTKRFAQRSLDRIEHFAAVLSLRAMLAVGVLIVLLVVEGGLRSATPSAQLLLLFVGAAFLLDSLSDVCISALRGHERINEEAIVNTVRATALLVGTLVWAWTSTGFSVTTAGLVFLFTALAKWCAAVVVARPDVRFTVSPESRAIWRDILGEAVPLGAAAVASQFVLRLDTLLILWFRGEREAGLYGVCYSIFSGVQIVWTAFLVSFFANASRRFALDPAAFWTRWFHAFGLTATYTIATALVLSFWARDLVRLLFGSSYVEGAAVLPLLLGVNVLLALTSLCAVGIVVSGRSMPIARVNLFALALHATLGLVIVPRLGFIGAGLVSMVTHSVALILLFRVVLQRRAQAALLAG